MSRARIIRIFVYLLGGIVVLIVAFVALLHTAPARRYVLEQVVAILDQQGIALAASRLEYNLLATRVELRDVVVRSKTATTLPPFARADRVAATLSLPALIRGSYDVKNAAIENPRVEVVVDRDGRDNLPHPPASPSKSTAPVDYLIRDARITGGSLRYEDRRQQLQAMLPVGTLSIHGNAFTRQHEIRWQAPDGGALGFAGRSMPVRGFAAEILLGRQDATVRSLRVGLGESTVNLTGKIASFAAPTMDVQADLNLALAALTEFAGAPQPVRGNLNAAIRVTGPPAQMRITARLRSEGLGYDRFDGLNLQADAVYEAASSRVQVQPFQLAAPWGRVRGQANLALTPQAGESTANVTADGVSLARVSALLNLPLPVASTATGQIEARWPALDFEHAAGNAAIRLDSAGVIAKDTLPVAATVHAVVRGEKATIEIGELRAAAASAAGTLDVTNWKSIAGNVTLQVPSAAATARDAGIFLGKPLGVSVDGALTTTATLAGTLEAPSAAIQLSAPDLSSADLKGIAVEASAQYDPERLTIHDALVKWQNQALRASGEVGLRGPEQPLRLTARTENLSAGATLAALGKGDLPLAAEIAAAIDVSGTLQDPRADIQLTATGLQAYRETLGALQAQARLEGQRLTVSELRLDKPQPDGPGLLTATGTYNIDSRQFQAQAQTQNLKLLTLTLPDGKAVRGTLDLQLTGSGLIDQPAADLKLSAVGLQVDGQDFGAAQLNVQASAGYVQLQAAMPRFGLTAKAETGVRSPNPASAEIRLQDSDLSLLPVKMDPPLKGAVSAVIQANGDIENYKDVKATAQVSRLDVEWNGVAVTSEAPLAASYDNRTLTIDRANLRAGDSRLELSGSLPLETTAGEGAIRMNAQLDLPGIVRLAKLEKSPDVQGTATIQGTVRGTLQRLNPDLTIALENASIAMEGLKPAVTNASLRGQVRDGALELESLSANWGAASLQAAGTIPFALLPPDLPVEIPRRAGPAKFTASVTGLDLAAIEGVPAQTKGVVSVRLEAEAPKPELQAVRAVLTFPELRLGFDNYTVEQKGTSRIVLENGIARVENFELTGPSTELAVTGTVDLMHENALQVGVDGKLDASLATLFADGIRARGATTVHAALTGTAKQPRAQGFIELTEGQLSVDQPRIGAEALNFRVDLDGATATLSKLEGEVNGGKLTGRGSITIADGQPPDADLSIQIADLYLDFPAGLKTISDLRLQLRTVEDHPVLRGTVLIKQGGFTDDLFPDKGILASATTPRSITTEEVRNALLNSLRLNVAVVTQDPIVVDNNLARAQITTQLVVLGNPYEMGLAGRLIIEEGGEITLQERRYTVERGVITFTNDRRIEPNLDLLATTTAAEHDITLQISGQPGKTETVLTANPDLPEPDILALLVTGRTLDQIRGQEFEVAQNQVLSYLTGRVGSSLGRRLEGATGLSRVRIEPNLIAAEANPSARLTVGQDITSQLNLVYSMDLVNSSDQIYIAEYDLTKRFVTRGTRQSDGTYRFDFRHDVRFGGTVPERRVRKLETRRVGNVSITGQPILSPKTLQDKLKVKTGDRYDFFKIRQGMDRISKLYVKENLLEASQRLRREDSNGNIDLTLQVEGGPKVSLIFEGVSLPGDVRDEVRRVWSSGVFDAQRVEDAAGVITSWLVREKYLTSKIAHQITTPQPDQKRVVFDIQRGPQFDDVEWVFDGAGSVEPKRLRSVIEDQKLATEVYTKHERVTELLTQYFRELGYLDAAVEKPRYELDASARKGKVIFPVKEGALYHVGEAVFDGNTAVSSAELLPVVPLPRGAEYRPVLRENSVQRLRDAYWNRGYNDVEIQADMERIGDKAQVNLKFRITENAQSIAREVTIEGNRHVSENLIRTQLAIKPGDPVNLEKIGESRRKLYNTGAFSLVEIAREDLGTASAGTRQVRLNVRVQEVQPFELKYGGFYDTERGPGGIFDLSNRNSLGSARVLGFRGRYDSQLQEARLYFSQPLLSRFPLKTIASPYFRREINPETDLTSAFNVDRIGISVQQEASLRDHFLLNYGYRIERSHTYDTGPDPFFDVFLRVAALTSTISRDTRDEILDASKGSFASMAFQYSPSLLGSEVRFVKYLGQYFRYFPLQKPKVELFTNQVLRPRLVFATGARVGLARGIGEQEVPVSERFFAGGATTIRGFEQNSVGPSPVGGTQLGGQAMLILNNELRFPLIHSIFGVGIDGAGFLDVGNVYEHISDFSITNIRKAAGPGIRLRTPWFLIRVDYGLKLDRRPGESAGRFFFSIGQAF